MPAGSRRRHFGTTAAVAVLATLASAGCGARLSAENRSLAISDRPAVAVSPGAEGLPVGPAPTTATGTESVVSGPARGGTAGIEGTEGTRGTTAKDAGERATGPRCQATAADNGGRTDTGVSATEIRVGTIADVSGPVPGLFKSALQAAQAYVTYFNATHPEGICGRRLTLEPQDSRTDTTSNRTATKTACDHDFAIVGSMSAFDDGGAVPVNECKIVDLPAIAVTTQRQHSPLTYAANSANTSYVADAVPNYFRDNFGDAYKHAGFLYIDAGAARQNGEVDIRAYKKVGWNFEYTAAVPIQGATTQGMKPHVQRLKDRGVQIVQWLGAYQQAAALAQAMDEMDYHPKVFLLDPTGYNPQYISLAGDTAEGTYVYTDAVPLSHADTNDELGLYSAWLTRSGVSDPPTYFGQFAWSAMRLFTEVAFEVGPHLTREAVTAELARVHHWSDNGMHPAMDVGEKRTGVCYAISQVRSDEFADVTKGYHCGGRIPT